MQSWFDGAAYTLGVAAIMIGTGFGVVCIFALAVTALTYLFERYLRRLNNIHSNWHDMASWVRSGRPVWTKVDNPDRPGAQYHRMVPQDGPAIDIPEIVPVHAHELLDRAIKTADRMVGVSEDEEWSYVASYLRDVKTALVK